MDYIMLADGSLIPEEDEIIKKKNELLIYLAEAKKRAVLKLIDCGGTMEGIKAIMEGK